MRPAVSGVVGGEQPTVTVLLGAANPDAVLSQGTGTCVRATSGSGEATRAGVRPARVSRPHAVWRDVVAASGERGARLLGARQLGQEVVAPLGALRLLRPDLLGEGCDP